MASDINPNNIDGTYPIAGIDNDTQGFRTNFTNTSTNFAEAKSEIEDLQSKSILTAPLEGESVTNNVLTTLLTTAASDTSTAGLRIQEGVAPSAPVDGDLWITAAGEFFAQLDGVAVDLAGGGGTEGTAVLSTGEIGGTKFLREDGDGTSSWQTVPAGGLLNIVEDLTPQLGGNLDVTGFTLFTISNSDETNDIVIAAGTTNYTNDEEQASSVRISGGDHLSADPPGIGGHVYITGGSKPNGYDDDTGESGGGGGIFITGGSVPNAGDATGGPITLTAGDTYAYYGSSFGGRITIKAGEAYDFPGDIILEAGGSESNASGAVTIQASHYVGTLGAYGPDHAVTPLRFMGLQTGTTLSPSGRILDNFVAIQAPDNVPTEYTLILPAAQPAVGQVLTASAPVSDVSTLSWASAGGGGLFSEDSDDNIIGGTGAGANITGTAGLDNFLGGVNAGTAITSGDNNIAIGNYALSTSQVTNNNIAVGRDSLLNAVGSQNVGIGSQAGRGIDSGIDNVAIGHQSLGAAAGNLTGADNIAIGTGVMNSSSLTTAFSNVAILATVSNMTTAQDNVIIGDLAGEDMTTGRGNVLIGHEAGHGITIGQGNVAIGRNAMADLSASITGSNNIAIGKDALDSTALTSGADNIAIGRATGTSMFRGLDNIMIGEGAGNKITDGDNNVMIGNDAGPTTDTNQQLFINQTESDTPMIGGDFTTGLVTFNGAVRFTERADHIGTPAATFGELWVRNDTPNVVVFTDDAGIDHDLVNSSIVEDTTPQLGGSLDVNGQDIISVSNGDITITPNGTGRTVITALEAPTAINTQAGTTYIPQLSDADGWIEMTNGAANTITIPANATTAFPIGTKLNFEQAGAGATTIAITTDTLNVNANLTLVLNGQYASATALKKTATTWVLYGNLVAV